METKIFGCNYGLIFVINIVAVDVVNFDVIIIVVDVVVAVVDTVNVIMVNVASFVF